MFNKLKEFFRNEAFMKYFKNSSWMMVEYGLKIISAIFVTIYVARYLGPEEFGLLSYALAIVAVFMAISRLGMESILVRDLAKYPLQVKSYMATAFGLMIVAAVVGLVILCTLMYFFESDTQTKVYVCIIAIGLLFQTLLVVDYSFQAQIQAKYSSIAKSTALGVSSLIKLYLVWAQADLLFFAIAYAIEHAVIGMFLMLMHFYRKQSSFFTGFNVALIKPLLKSSWPMVLASLSTILYMRIDQIMIKNILNSYELGLYSAAARLYEGWIIVPYVLTMSLLPVIVSLKNASEDKYYQGLSKMFALVFWVSVLVAVIFYVFSEEIVLIIFGKDYLEMQKPLVILMWSSAFASLGFVSARYFTVEHLEKKIFIRTFVALILNIILNFILIPVYGIEGAAFSTLVSVFVSNYVLDFIDPVLRQQLRMKNKALLLFKY
jgi:O-antigen/teichoic acid export membrane protein